MIRRITIGRLLVFCLFVGAQLSIAEHMADHGPGKHEHDNVPCLLGATNDDDTLAPPPAAACFGPVVRVKAPPTTVSASIVPGVIGLRPPATGPPILA